MKSIEIKGKRNQDKLFNQNSSKRLEDIIPEIGEKYKDHYCQIKAINTIYLEENLNFENHLIEKSIIKKISNYKQQDVKKRIFNKSIFVNKECVIQKLVESKLKCFYCNQDTLLVYSDVKEPSQWTLDRIDNSFGHNKNNVLIACLKCNLERGDMEQSKFRFTKNLQIKKIN